MGVVFVPLYVKYLGIEAYGLIGFFAILQAWFTLLDLGMAPTLNREMARFTGGACTAQQICDLLRTLEIICFFIAGIIMLVIFALSDWLASEWLRTDRLEPESVFMSISVMGVVIGLRLVESIYRSSLLGLQRQIQFNFMNAGLATLRNLGAVAVLAWIAPTIEAFFIWQSAVSLISIATFAMVVYFSLPKPEKSPTFSLGVIKDVKEFAGGTMAAAFLALMLSQVDKILVSRLLSLEDFGYYTLAVTMAGCISLIGNPIAQAVYPQMAQLVARRDENALVHVYHESTQLFAVVAVPIALVISVYADEVMYAWTGDLLVSRETGALLSILVIGNLLSGLMVIPSMLQFAHGWTGFIVKFNSVAVLAVVPALVYTIPRFGGIGAAWIWLILNVSYIFLGIHLLHRRLLPEEKWAWYLKDLALPSVGALSVCLISMIFIKAPQNHRLEYLFFLVLCTLTAFIAAAMFAPRVRIRICNALLKRRTPISVK